MGGDTVAEDIQVRGGEVGCGCSGVPPTRCSKRASSFAAAVCEGMENVSAYRILFLDDPSSVGMDGWDGVLR